MRAIVIDRNLAKIVATRALGMFSERAYVSGISPLDLVDVQELPLPNARAVRVRNRLAGICGSDLSLVSLKVDLNVAPALVASGHRMVLGHEVVGLVEDVGPDAAPFTAGDRVVLRQGPETCGPAGRSLCRACADGLYNRCEGLGKGASFPMQGGGWADGMVVAGEQLHPVPPPVSDEAAVLIEPAACALRAVLRARVPDGETVVVVLGAGTIGILCVRFLRLLHPDCRILVQARHPFQAREALRSGAEIAVTGDGELRDAVADATDARVCRPEGAKATGPWFLVDGAARILDCVGRAATLQMALRLAAAGGRVVVVGVDLQPRAFDYSPLWFREVDLVGSGWHGAEVVGGKRISTFDLVCRHLEEGRLVLADLLTHRYRLDGYRRAILEASNKGVFRVFKGVFDLAR